MSWICRGHLLQYGQKLQYMDVTSIMFRLCGKNKGYGYIRIIRNCAISNNILKLLMALPLLPPQQIIEGFNSVLRRARLNEMNIRRTLDYILDTNLDSNIIINILIYL